MPVLTDVGGGVPAQPVQPEVTIQRRKRKGQPDYTPPLEQAVYIVERESRGTLPGAVSAALATANQREKDLTRAARAVARNFDVPAAWIWGDTDWRELEDPYHPGHPMSVASMRRITEDMKPQLLANMVPTLLDVEAAGTRAAMARGEEVPGGPKLSAKKVAEFVRIIGQTYSDVYIQADQGLALAIELARAGINPKTYRGNLEQMQRWAAVNDREGVLDWASVAVLAERATLEGARLTDTLAVARYLFPEIAAKAEAQVQLSEGMFTRIPDGGISPLTQQQYNPLYERLDWAQALRDLSDGTQAERGNLFEVANELQESIVMDRTSFERSFLGQGLMWVGDKLNTGLLWAERGIVTLSTPIIGVLSEVLPDEEGAGWSEAFTFRDETFARLEAGQHLGSQVAEDMGLPGWVGGGLDFALGWYLDPFILGGKLAKGAKALRYAPGLAERTTTFGAVASKLAPTTYDAWKARRLVALGEDFTVSGLQFARRYSRRAGQALMQDDDAVRAFVGRFLTDHGKTTALDEAYLQLVGKELRARFGSLTDDALKEVRWALQTHFGVVPKAGSVAEAAYRARLGITTSAQEAIRGSLLEGRVYTEAGSGLLVPRATAVDLAESVLHDRISYLPLSLEVPTRIRPIPGFGFYRSVTGALEDTRLADSALGRRWIALWNSNKGKTLISINQEVGEQYFARARRWREFDARETRYFSEEAVKARASLQPEAGLEAVAREMDELAIERIAMRTRGLTAADIPSLKADLAQLRSDYATSMRSFGAVPEGATATRAGAGRITRPIMETQLLDELALLDPILVRKYIRRWAGMRRAFEKNMPDDIAKALAKGQPLRQALDRRRDVLDPLLRSGMRGWKMMVVPRMGYVGRVVLLDESIRFFSTGFSVMERAAATNVDEALSVLLKAASYGLAPKKLTDALATVPGKGANRFFNWLYPNYKVKVGDEVVELVTPSRMAFEPLANTTWRQAELLDEMMRRSLNYEKLLTSGGSWDILEAGMPNYYTAWAHALDNQLGQSIPGRVALESVGRGDDVSATVAALKDWAAADRYSIFKGRLGFDMADLEDWAGDLAKLAHAYTIGDAELARLALARGVREAQESASVLGRAAIKPPVHGPSIEYAAFGKSSGQAGMLDRLTHYVYDSFVRLPENIVNRQPYYRLWKQRAERAYRAMAKPEAVTPALREQIDQASHRFALGQVKAVMFDFADQARIGEMLGFVYPFVQPFAEAFQVYGHILLRRNPAMAGYITRAWNLATDSGFVQKDPQTGEYVVPLTNWMGGALWLRYAAHIPGARLVTPVNSLNLFFASSMRLPADGFLGKVAGGVPLPLPGLAPWAAIPLKKFFETTGLDTNPAIASYLFAYGPDSPLVSPWMNRLYKAGRAAIDPNWAGDEREIQALAMDFVVEYQYRGMYQDMTPEQMQAKARADATRAVAVRGVLNFGQLGPSMIEWEWDPIREEFFALVAEHGYDEGRELFLEKYPHMSAITVGKTRFTEGVMLPDTGEVIPNTEGIRIPASEYAKRFLELPEMREVAERTQYLPFVGALILEADPAVAEEQSFAVWSEWVASGMVKYKSIHDYISDVEAIGVEGDKARAIEKGEGFWQAVEAFDSYYFAAEERLKERGLGDDNEAFTALRQERADFLISLQRYFPLTANRYIEYTTDEQGNPTDARWALPTNGAGVPHPVVMANLRAFARIPEIQDFDAVKGLAMYLEGRDAIAAEMGTRGITDITSSSAQETGLTRRFEELRAAVVAEHPYAEPFLDIFLSNDLEWVPNEAEQELRDLRSQDRQRWQTIVRFDTQYERLSDEAFQADTSELRAAGYQAAREFADATYATDPEAVRYWWRTKSHYEQQQYMERLRVRPVEFMSRFDLHLLGLDIDGEAAQMLTWLGQQRVRITQEKAERELEAKDYDTTKQYNALEAQVRAWMQDNATFAAVVQAADQWGWALRGSSLTEGYSRPAQAWRAVFEAVDWAQGVADARDLVGTEYGTAEDTALYSRNRQLVLDYVRELRDWDEGFDKQWRELQGTIGGPVIEWLIPDLYFRMAG